ncbi:myosin light chain kinase, smooth muscle-like isoform X3 [Argopecten irradians]|uniref:myosin light chain kinase, smooth muscle-like isoform X3 n=1 Tax=Argopecten irradians TaxID=31199 RepID=UPI003722D37D
MNQLHHPKLMQLHEAFDQTGEMVMILELLSGGELFDRLVAQDYEFTEEDCIVYMRQICQGVRHMHQQNIIHLDLKPENVMCVTKDTRDIKLIDFGLAQKLEEGKSVKVLFGTAEFCAPEIISFEPVSFCSDMWSIGVVSYVLLSGYSPFAGDTDQETFTNINRSDYDFADDVWDNISDDARDFINKLLVRDRSKRMTIDEALAHPWLNGAAEKKLTGTKLSTQHHKEYQQRKRHREDELDILPIGRISRDSAIFRREGEQGIIAKNIIMELPPHAPVFCEPLTDVSGFEGSRIEMTCKISAKPAPRIKWFKDGEELQEGKKYHMTYSDYYASLFVSDLDPEDAGKYRCKAFNDLGEDSTTGKLAVEEILHRRKRKEELESLKVKYPKHDYDLSLLDSNIPPSFTLPLIDQVKHVGENCEFTVTVTCRPEPEVTWFHNNEEVHESEAFEFVHSKGVYRLIIHGVETLDAGQWRCEAVNKYGHSWCSCDLKVIDTMPEGGEPPVFIRKLQDTTIVEGSSVQLECKVKGQPHPEIEWYKDRKLIRSGRHYAISKEGSTCILTIHEAFPEDTGKYMCRAVNTVSSTTTEAQLRVQKAEGEESEFLFEHYVPDEARLVEKTVHFKIETEPNFTATLKDKSATVGTHVKMLCSITGIPAPRVIMYHNDRDVTGDDHYMITNNHGLVSLEFYSVKLSDAGRYTCKAINSEGEVSCQARLQVLDVEEEAPKSPDYVRPSFTTPIHDLTVTAGDEATFSCVAIGKPMPGFKWQKDMVDITDSHRIFMGADSDGAAELILRSARVSDSGLYSCVAQSTAGRTKCSAYLRVLAKSKSRSPPDSPETAAAKKLEQRYERARMEIPGGRGPRFVEPLPKVVELDEGDKLRLECEVEGYPKPKVTWYKATRNLTYDYRHRVKVEQTMHTLEVNDVTVIDAGEFIAKAANDLGEAETRCIVRVNRRRTEKEREVTTEAAQRAADELQQGYAPFFIKHLPHSIDVMEGMDVQLDCIVEGDVTMVKYKRAEAKVVTEHFQSGDFEGTYHDVPMAAIPTMSMPGAEGGAGSRPRLNIPEPGAKRAPRFVEEMEDGTIVTGSIATMSVVVDAVPAAEVTWFKDNKKIRNTDHYETYFEDGAHNLEIFDTITSDSGVYRCVARNEMGSAECQCKLGVKVRGGAGEESFSTPSNEEEDSEVKDAGPRKFPPRFVVELEPEIMVAIGEDVKLVCIIDDALERVHWEKDGKKMSEDSRTKIVQEADGTQQLDLSKAIPTDDGIYSCVAKTTGGETVTTETKLCVTDEKFQSTAVGEETKPKFTKQLKDVYCKDGEEVTLECQVTGLPRPQMTWHKDKHEILDSQDFQISTIGNKCRLTIAEVFPEDEGRYICKAINSLGEATASCQLLVEDTLSYDSASMSSSTYSRGGSLARSVTDDQNNTDLQIDPVSKKLVKDKKSGKEKEKVPEFIVKPRRQFVNEGQTAKFKASYDDTPQTKLTWSRTNGDALSSGGKYKIYEENDFHWLEVRDVKSEDSGSYTCVISNSAGSNKADVDLDVYVKPQTSSKKSGFVAPKVDIPLNDLVVSPGDKNVTLECKFSNAIDASASWYKDGRLMTSGFLTKQSFDGRLARLVLSRVASKDSGKYQCVVTNTGGEAKTLASLTVSSAGTRAIAPKFVNPLTNQSLSVGDKLVLEAKVTGYPRPTVHWYKEKEELTSTEANTMEFDGSTVRLVMPSVKVTDSATYKCVAENEAGKDQIKAKITITSTTKDQSPDDFREPPTFVRELHDMEVDNGDRVELSVEVKGMSPMDIVWLHDDQNISTTDPFAKILSHGNVHELLISKVISTDAGRYSCQVQSEAGRAETHCRLCVAERKIDNQIQEELIFNTRNAPNEHVNNKNVNNLLSEQNEHFANSMDNKEFSSVESSVYQDKTLKGPGFILRPRTAFVSAGNSAIFLCRTSGVPPPSVEWSREGEIITNQGRYKIKNGEDCTLEVKGVSESDVGTYTCTLKSPGGTVSTDTRLVLSTQSLTRHTPTLSRNLHSPVLKKISHQESAKSSTVDQETKPNFVNVKLRKTEKPETKSVTKRVPDSKTTYSLKQGKSTDNTMKPLEQQRQLAESPSVSKQETKSEKLSSEQHQKFEELSILPEQHNNVEKSPILPKQQKNSTESSISSRLRTKLEESPRSSRQHGQSASSSTGSDSSDLGTKRGKIADASPSWLNNKNSTPNGPLSMREVSPKVPLDRGQPPANPKKTGVNQIDFRDVLKARTGHQVSPTVKEPISKSFTNHPITNSIANLKSPVIANGTMSTSKSTVPDRKVSKGKVSEFITALEKPGVSQTVKENVQPGKVKLTPGKVKESVSTKFTPVVLDTTLKSKFKEDQEKSKFKPSKLDEHSKTSLPTKKFERPVMHEPIKSDLSNNSKKDSAFLTQKKEPPPVAPKTKRQERINKALDEIEEIGNSILKMPGGPPIKDLITMVEDDSTSVTTDDSFADSESSYLSNTTPSWAKENFDSPSVRNTPSSGFSSLRSNNSCENLIESYPCESDDSTLHSESMDSGIVHAESMDSGIVRATPAVPYTPITLKNPTKKIESSTKNSKTSDRSESSQNSDTESVKMTKLEFEGPVSTTIEKTTPTLTVNGTRSRRLSTESDKSKPTPSSPEHKEKRLVRSRSIDKVNNKPPSFLTTLEDVTVPEGRCVILECQVTGIPRPEVLWFMNNNKIKPSKFFQMTYVEDTARLVIKGAYPEDDGFYLCLASNCVGTERQSCILRVKECHTMSTEEEDNMSESNQAPHIHEISPPNLTVLRGNKAQVQVSYTAEPRPNITWLQNKVKVESGNRFTINTTEHFSRLIINEVTLDDAGIYDIDVENDVGRDTGSMAITVEDVPDPPIGKPYASEIALTYVILSWSGPAYDGGSLITNYKVEMCEAEYEVWNTLTDNCHSTSYHTANLTPHTPYFFRVSAENKHGMSKPSETSDVVVTKDRRVSERLSIESDDVFLSSTSTASVSPFTPLSPQEEEPEIPFSPRLVSVKMDVKFEAMYDLQIEVGKGKFGNVHICVEKDDKEEKKWAAKVIKCRGKDKAAVQREIEIMNQLLHPKLLMLRDAFETARKMILVMEYVGGGELFERVIDEDFELTERDCVHFVRQICEGVDYMHSKSIVHLDLKPENILCIRKDSNLIKIIDFGLAQFHKPGESLRAISGTPEFIAPEVVNYDEIGFQTDIWSIGVICYVLLSGLSPFMGDTDAETLSNVTAGEFDFDDEAFEDISIHARDFIEKALKLKRTNRPSAKDCLNHKWLVKEQNSGAKKLRQSLRNLKQFMARRKWQKMGMAIRALGRMSSLQKLVKGDRATSDSSVFSDSDTASQSDVSSQPSRSRSSSKLEDTSAAEQQPTVAVVTDPPERPTILPNSDTTEDNVFKDKLQQQPTPADNKDISPDTDYCNNCIKGQGQENDLHNESISSIPRTLSAQSEPDTSENASLRFVREMVDCHAVTGDIVRFDVTVSSDQDQDIHWFQEDIEIVEDDRHSFVYNDNGACSLIIRDVSEEDDGEFICKASNCFGEITCSADLIIYGTGSL